MGELTSIKRLDPREEVGKFLEILRVRGYREKSIRYYRYGLKMLLKYLGDAADINELGKVSRETVEGFRVFVFSRKTATGSALDFRTQKNILQFTKSFFRWLYDEGLVAEDPARGMKYPRLPKRISENHLSQVEMRALLEAATTETVMGFFDRTFFEVFYATGMRQGEMTALKLEDLRLCEGLLNIVDGKGGKDRVAVLTETARKYLEVYLTEVRERYLRRAKSAGGKSEFVFPNTTGKKMLPGDISRKLRRYKALAKIGKEISPHVFRRSMATHFLEAGVDVRYIQALLGHRNTQTTLEYLRVTTADLRRAIERHHPRAIKNRQLHERAHSEIPRTLEGDELFPKNLEGV